MILHESRDGISTIYFNRADRYNALNREVVEELLETVGKVEKNDDRIIILTGKGNAFSAGGDIAMMKDFANREFFDGVMETIEKIALKLFMMPKIIISAINGPAVGVGLSLALAADYIIADKGARLGMLFIGIGLAPDGGGHFFLKERIGMHQAKQFIWNGKQADAETAKEMGIIDMIADQNCADEAAAFAEKLLASPLEAMIKTKMLYHAQAEKELKACLENERKTQWELRGTEDHREGVQAFLEKRKPVFKGN